MLVVFEVMLHCLKEEIAAVAEASVHVTKERNGAIQRRGLDDGHAMGNLS